MRKLTSTQKNLVGGGVAVVVGLALLKKKLGEKVASTAVANANAQVEAQSAINDAVATAQAPPPSVAGLDGLGYDARQAVMRSSGYRNALAGAQGRQKAARMALAGLRGMGVMPAVARSATPPAVPHHLPGRVFQQDMHSPWNRVGFDSPLNYPNLEGPLAGAGRSGALPGMGTFPGMSMGYPSVPGGQASGGMPGMGLLGRLGAMVSSALPGMGVDAPAVPNVDDALNTMATTINASIGLVSGAVIIGLAYWGMKK